MKKEDRFAQWWQYCNWFDSACKRPQEFSEEGACYPHRKQFPNLTTISKLEKMKYRHKHEECIDRERNGVIARFSGVIDTQVTL